MTSRTFPVPGPIELSCRLGYGSVTVHAEDGVTEATVELTPRDPGSDLADRTTVDLRGKRLVVHAPKPRGGVFDFPIFGHFGERDAIDMEIRLPADSAVNIASFGADVVVTGRCGPADIAGGSTSTRLDDVSGDLRLRHGSGSSQANRVSGSVVVKSGSGPATFAEVGGPLVMACGSGTLDVGVAHGAVRMRTGSGHASVRTAEGDVDFVGGSGDVSIGLPAGLAARLDVVTGSGRVHSDLPVEDAPTDRSARSIAIRARTGSGDIRLFRAQPAQAQTSSPESAA